MIENGDAGVRSPFAVKGKDAFGIENQRVDMQDARLVPRRGVPAVEQNAGTTGATLRGDADSSAHILVEWARCVRS